MSSFFVFIGVYNVRHYRDKKIGVFCDVFGAPLQRQNWLVWETEFKREMVGKMPTKCFFTSFKSFSDGAKANINIKLTQLLMSITRLKRSLKLLQKR
jgi:hypothetical protein